MNARAREGAEMVPSLIIPIDLDVPLSNLFGKLAHVSTRYVGRTIRWVDGH